MELKDLLEVLETRITNIKKENHTHFNEGRIYELELTVGVVKSLLFRVGKAFNDKNKTNNKILRTELIEFLEANNYFISTLETEENAIGIVDSYIKNYKL